MNQKKNSFYKILLLVAGLFFCINNNYSNLLAKSSAPVEIKENNPKFAVISIQKVSEGCLVFQDIRKQMENKANEMRMKFDAKTKDLRKDEQSLEGRAKLLNKEALDSEIHKINQKKQSLNEDLNNDRQKLEKAQFEAMSVLNQKIYGFIANYAKSKKYDAILEASNLVYHDFEVINDQIIEMINKEIKEFKIKFD